MVVVAAVAMAVAVAEIKRAMVMPNAMTKTAAVIIAMAATTRFWAIVTVVRLVTVWEIGVAVVAAHVDEDNVRVVTRRSCVYLLVWMWHVWGRLSQFVTNACDTDE